MRTYKVPALMQDDTCGNCGAPVCAGDRAYETADGHVACCRECAQVIERAEHEHAE